ncbi:MAG: exodeoxyribonuclease VII small subunit [Candidatus Methanoperedenaceae archaeon]|nr:MAG: exodeoxyribonuclease VII small subunit [Candidatus Methanoperedenaceae archaeon]
MHMEMSFEESLKELEGIVDKLEKGQLSLDESLMLFEKGIKLVRECNTKIQCAQQKVEQLILENGGSRTEKFEMD